MSMPSSVTGPSQSGEILSSPLRGIQYELHRKIRPVDRRPGDEKQNDEDHFHPEYGH